VALRPQIDIEASRKLRGIRAMGGGVTKEVCAICGCNLHRGRNVYAGRTIEGRSHAGKSHYVAERFFGRSKNRKGMTARIFEVCPWGVEGKSTLACYECHELMLHNPILLQADVKLFAEIVRARGLSETEKPEDFSKIAGRILLFQEVISKGIKQLHDAEKSKSPKRPSGAIRA
jgi:hypothetical protein